MIYLDVDLEEITKECLFAALCITQKHGKVSNVSVTEDLGLLISYVGPYDCVSIECNKKGGIEYVHTSIG